MWLKQDISFLGFRFRKAIPNINLVEVQVICFSGHRCTKIPVLL